MAESATASDRQQSIGLLGRCAVQDLTSEQQQLLRRLDAFQAPFLQRAVVRRGLVTTEQFYRAFTEFKKFVFLVHWTGSELAVTSEAVDMVWHEFILFTREYTHFCEEFLGHYLHHLPCGNEDSLNGGENLVRSFVAAYEAIFGSLADVWHSEPAEMRCSNPSPVQCRAALAAHQIG